ncbi:MAG: resA 1 [Verrucomicrobiales bacterium]|nr:resA 1 [Verrucomicrobiales bacterium]
MSGFMKNLVKTFLPWGFLAVALMTSPVYAVNPPAATNAVPAKADSEGDKAWLEVEKALKPPVPPAEWNQKQPSKEEISAFNEKQKAGLINAIDKLHAFYTKFPQHPKAEDARKDEFQMLQYAKQMGIESRSAEFEARKQERIKSGVAGEDEKFGARMKEIQKEAMKKRSEGEAAVMGELEKGVRQVQKEFPKRTEIYEMLLMIANSSDDSKKAREIAKEISQSGAGDDIKQGAEELLKKLERVGKPVVIKFKAVDGREVDTTKMTNKVVLIDFWATWCGPCVAEIPHVKEAYAKFHSKGFEIIGLSFDQDKSKLEKFVAEKKMEWPQYFDGKGWQNEYGQQYGINSIPVMWLLDKKGNLRDVNGRDDLASKVEKMLAE